MTKVHPEPRGHLPERGNGTDPRSRTVGPFPPPKDRRRTPESGPGTRPDPQQKGPVPIPTPWKRDRDRGRGGREGSETYFIPRPAGPPHLVGPENPGLVPTTLVPPLV